jgi:two-component system, OmpR family, osmolarity sensor histidine kinase EnvZ
MARGWLKRYTPRGLYGRALLILVLPVVVLLLVVSVVFVQRHFEGVTRQMTRNAALDLAYLVELVNDAPSLAAAQTGAAGGFAGAVRYGLGPAGAPPDADRRRVFDLPGRQVIATLRAQLPGILAIDLAGDDKLVALTIDTRHGPMRAVFPRNRVSASNPHQLLVLTVGTGLLMIAIATLFLRNQLRPIRRLATMAEAFGRGQSVTWPPSGATEVRAATRAFLDMRARIERHIEQRTLLLSGVSHDLRTPLTRLRLGLAMLDETSETAALLRDVTEMERLIDEFLAFTRDGAAEGMVEARPLDIARAAVAEAARGGHSAELVAAPGIDAIAVPMRPHAVRRALLNLLDNAARHASRSRLTVAARSRAIAFTVEDDGPGIPKAQRAAAARPFVRLEPARGQNRAAGVGLGLAIATDIARSHGGGLSLGESVALGGLSAELTVARDAAGGA